VATLYTNENFPFPAAEELRRLGHDVMTVQESGLGGQSASDDAVLRFAIDHGRTLITLNRRHFVKLHEETPGHQGIIVCTTDSDFRGLASRIDAAVKDHSTLQSRLIRVNRPA
jgi:predicted nuclease of predicted toxin-antitoxin system